MQPYHPNTHLTLEFFRVLAHCAAGIIRLKALSLFMQIYCLDSGSCVPLDRSCQVDNDGSFEEPSDNEEGNDLCMNKECSNKCNVSP